MITKDTLRTQLAVFEENGLQKTITVTVDESALTFTLNGRKFLPKGHPLGAGVVDVSRVDLLGDRTQKVIPCNDNRVFGLLSADTYFDDGDKEVTLVYDCIAYKDDVEAALTEYAEGATTLDARTITAFSTFPTHIITKTV